MSWTLFDKFTAVIPYRCDVCIPLWVRLAILIASTWMIFQRRPNSKCISNTFMNRLTPQATEIAASQTGLDSPNIISIRQLVYAGAFTCLLYFQPSIDRFSNGRTRYKNNVVHVIYTWKNSGFTERHLMPKCMNVTRGSIFNRVVILWILL